MSLCPARFVENRSSLDGLLQRLSRFSCKHCGRAGTLIGHGFLWGYAEGSSELEVRGRRLFCSNRGRKGGCGQTVSVLLAEMLVGFMLRASTLWEFLSKLAEGLSAERARPSHWQLSVRSAYRVAQRLKSAAVVWRAWLCAQQAPPASASLHPLAQLKAHCIAVLGSPTLAQFQLRTSRSLL